MKRLLTIVPLICSLIAFTSNSWGTDARHLVRIDLAATDDITDLRSLHIDIASFKSGEYIDAVLSDIEVARVKALGYKTDYLIEDLSSYFQKNINTDGDLGDYHTYDEMLFLLQIAAARFPDICKLYDIGDSWEKTEGIADRDIWALKISDDPGNEDPGEPDILFVGNHHARELITVEIPLALIRELLTGYRNEPQIIEMVNNKEIWIIPMLNPDGHVMVETGDEWWRKNLNRNGSIDPSQWGVDLNRNYSYKWGYDDLGSSPNRWSETYRGESPFSEPETQAIRDLTESHEFVISISYHSYGDLFLVPWGYIDGDTPDHPTFGIISEAYTAFNNYIWGNANSGIIYNTNGDHNDWMYGEQSTKNMVYGCTVEAGSSFWPPDNQIPGIIEENLNSSLILIRGI